MNTKQSSLHRRITAAALTVGLAAAAIGIYFGISIVVSIGTGVGTGIGTGIGGAVEPAFANTSITTVSISGIEAPVPGKIPMEITDSCIKTAGASIDATNTRWSYNVNGSWYANNGKKFEEGKLYSIFFRVLPKSGYEFSAACGVLVNGNKVTDVENKGTELRFRYVFVEGDPVVSTVSLTGVQVPKEGDLPITSGIKTGTKAVYSDSANTMWEYRPFGSEASYKVTGGKTFEEGVKYNFRTFLKTTEGYRFADHVDITVNGEVSASATIKQENDRSIELILKDITPTPLTPTDSGTVYVVTDKASAQYYGFRSENVQPFGSLTFGVVVKSNKESGNWIGFMDGSQQGWIKRSHLGLAYDEETARAVYCTVTAGAVNIHADMSKTSSRLGGLTAGDRILTTGKRTDAEGNEWYYMPQGSQLGYVMGKYLKEEPVSIPSFYIMDIAKAVTAKSEATPAQSVWNLAGLKDANIASLSDGSLQARILPDEGYAFDKLDSTNVHLPDPDYVLTGVDTDGGITVTFKNAWTYDTGKTMKVLTPKLKAGKKKVTVKWSKESKAAGYKIRYSYKKDMSSAKTVTVKGAKKTSRVIKKLKKGKKVYVQVYPYVNYKGSKINGLLGSVKSAKVK